MTRGHALAEYGAVIDARHPRVDWEASGAERGRAGIHGGDIR